MFTGRQLSPGKPSSPVLLFLVVEDHGDDTCCLLLLYTNLLFPQYRVLFIMTVMGHYISKDLGLISDQPLLLHGTGVLGCVFSDMKQGLSELVPRRTHFCRLTMFTGRQLSPGKPSSPVLLFLVVEDHGDDTCFLLLLYTNLLFPSSVFMRLLWGITSVRSTFAAAWNRSAWFNSFCDSYSQHNERRTADGIILLNNYSSSTPIYSSGSSSTPIYSPGSSSTPIYSRNAECSNCKHLLDKITVLEATVDMYIASGTTHSNSSALYSRVATMVMILVCLLASYIANLQLPQVPVLWRLLWGITSVRLGDSSNSRSAESTLKDRDLTSRVVLFVTCLTNMKTLEDHGDDTCCLLLLYTNLLFPQLLVTREHNVQHDPPKLVEVIKVTTGDFNHPVSFHEDDLPKGALQILIRIEFLSTMSFMCLRRDRIGSLKLDKPSVTFSPTTTSPCRSIIDLVVQRIGKIKIYVGDSPCLLLLDSRTTIQRVKALFRYKTGFSSFYQLRLVYTGRELQGSHTLAYYYVENGSILRRLNDSRMRGIFQIIYVIIASTGKLMHLRVDRLCTINEVKVMIQDHEGIPAQLQTLFSPPKAAPRMLYSCRTTTSMLKTFVRASLNVYRSTFASCWTGSLEVFNSFLDKLLPARVSFCKFSPTLVVKRVEPTVPSSNLDSLNTKQSEPLRTRGLQVAKVCFGGSG
ncbi:senescence-specific cysteine protease SAG39-like protein [Tanacetum coccineum]